MALTIKENDGGNYQDISIGTHIGRCVKIIDIGTQRGEYNGEPKVKKKIILTFEFPNELMEDGKPFTHSAFYTASLHENATLRQTLEQWRGKPFTKPELEGFNLKNVLGAPGMVSVVKNQKGKTIIGGIMALPKGTPVPQQVNPSVVFDIDEWDQEVFDALSDGLKRMIMESDEYKERVAGYQPPGEEEPPGF